MADPVVLRAAPVFTAAPIVAPGLRITAVDGLAFASIAAGKDGVAALRSKLGTVFNLMPPSGPGYVEAAGIGLLGVAPGAWLAFSPDAMLADRLSEACDGLAAVADQSGAYGVLELDGPSAREVLARLVAIDLDPDVFPQRASAVLALGHLGGVLWREPGAHRFRLALSRSTAADAWRAFDHAALAATARN